MQPGDEHLAIHLQSLWLNKKKDSAKKNRINRMLHIAIAMLTDNDRNSLKIVYPQRYLIDLLIGNILP